MTCLLIDPYFEGLADKIMTMFFRLNRILGAMLNFWVYLKGMQIK